MNNFHFKTFICVVEAGSFNKAAKNMYLTSTAVIKQINQLETELGFPLFERSHRGLALTKAGKSLYKDAKYITEYCKEAVKKAQNAMMEEQYVIRIGTSPMTPVQLMTDLWPKVHAQCADINFQLVPFENSQENAREILRNLGQNLMMIHYGWSHYVDKVRDELMQYHQQVNIIDFDLYDVGVFNRCEQSRDVLLVIKRWYCVHPMIN